MTSLSDTERQQIDRIWSDATKTTEPEIKIEPEQRHGFPRGSPCCLGSFSREPAGRVGQAQINLPLYFPSSSFLDPDELPTRRISMLNEACTQIVPPPKPASKQQVAEAAFKPGHVETKRIAPLQAAGALTPVQAAERKEALKARLRAKSRKR